MKTQSLARGEAKGLWRLSLVQSTGLCLQITLVFTAIRVMIFFAQAPDSPVVNDYLAQIILSILGNGVVFLPVLVWCKLGIGDLIGRDDQRLKSVFTPQKLGAAFLAILGVNLLMSHLAACLATILPGGINSASPVVFPWAEGPFSIVCYYLLLTVFASFGEELVYRGAILMPLRRYGDGFAIGVSALFFALAHGNLQQIPGAFAAGVFFGLVTCGADSILPAILLHMLNNGFSFWMAFFAGAENRSLSPVAGQVMAFILRLMETIYVFSPFALLLWLVFAKPWRYADNRKVPANQPYLKAKWLVYLANPMTCFFLFYTLEQIYLSFRL